MTIGKNDRMSNKADIEVLDPLAKPILPHILKSLREEYLDTATGKIGLTQAELAGILSVSVSAIKKWESEKNSSIPDSKSLVKLCILYNTELYFSPDPKLKHPVLLEREQDEA